MKKYYLRIRVFLFTLAIGLAGIFFSTYLSERYSQIPVDLPQAESESPFYVFPYEPPKPVTEAEFIQGRDISLYDSEKLSQRPVSTSKFEADRRSRIQLINFIWDHFKNKKRGYITYEWVGDHAPGSAHIFIEPDESGRWIIIMRQAGHIFHSRVYEEKAYSIKYKFRTKHDLWIERGEQYLSLLDEKGNEFDVF